MAEPIHVDTQPIQPGEWQKFLMDGEDIPDTGNIVRMGILEQGTTSGRPALQMIVEMEDGTKVHVQATWRAAYLAFTVLAERFGFPE